MHAAFHRLSFPVLRFPLLILAVLLAAGPWLAAPTQAQQDPARSKALDDINRLQERFRELIKPKATTEPLIPETDDPLPPAQAKKIRFTLNDLLVQGATVYAPEELRPLFEERLGRETTLQAVYEIAAEIEKRYRNDGYILAQVFPPAQRVSAGVVRLQVMEGFIDKIEIEGKAGDYEAIIEGYARQILQSRPLNNEVLERYLLLANDLPGLIAKAVLIPSFETEGASDVILQLKTSPAGGSASIDNRGTKFVGPYQASLGHSFYSPFGRAGKLDLRGINSLFQETELHYLQAGYQMPLGSDGATLAVSLTGNKAAPGSTLKDSDVKSRSESVSVRLDYPWIRARRKNVSLQAAFTYRDNVTNLAGARLTEDRVRSLKLGVSGDYADSFKGITLVDAGLTQGLTILGTREKDAPLSSRPRGRTDFLKFNLDVARLQRLNKDTRLLVAMTGQRAAHRLLASEQFGYGGGNFGRAFDPSELSGDDGIAFKVELQYTLPEKLDYLKYLQYYAFYDWGHVRRPAEPNQNTRDSAASVGLGARMSMTDRISGGLEIAQPLIGRTNARNASGEDPRLFVRLSSRF